MKLGGSNLDEYFKVYPFLESFYHLSPYSTPFLTRNFEYFKSNQGANDKSLASYFHGKIEVCTRGTEAICLALESLELEENDEVFIRTSSGGKYVSSCVTSSIEKFCKWSFEETKNTRAVFLIHEFGYFCDMPKLELHQSLPIIEDCAYAFPSEYRSDFGKTGDFVIYSFPKAFPVNFGGLLEVRNKKYTIGNSEIDKQLKKMIVCLVEEYIQSIEEFQKRRLKNYSFLESSCKRIGLRPYFDLTERDLPSAFVFREDSQEKAIALKKHLTGVGIECSVFYQNNGFFIPNHQELTDVDLAYFMHHLGEFYA